MAHLQVRLYVAFDTSPGAFAFAAFAAAAAAAAAAQRTLVIAVLAVVEVVVHFLTAYQIVGRTR